MNKIFVATHKQFNINLDDIYIPLQVGRYNKRDLGYLCDNTGDNISDKNNLYGELTGLYWIWKNETQAENIGLCHYRRYFFNENGSMLNDNDLNDILGKYDIILPYKTYCPGMNYYDMFCASHNEHDLKVIEETIGGICPEYLEDYQTAIHGNLYYMGNLFITSRKLFCEYSNWLFSIFKVAQEKIDVSGYDEYHARVYGFLSEQMLMAWVIHNKLNVYETEVRIVSEKSEVAELVADVGNVLKKEGVDKAVEYYTEYLKKRPDVKFKEADVNNILPKLELVLDIVQNEKNMGVEQIQWQQGSIDEMISCVDELCNNIYNKSFYLKQSTIYSWVMLERVAERYGEGSLIDRLNLLANTIFDAGMIKNSLELLKYALSIDSKCQKTIRNITAICGVVNKRRGSMNVCIATNRRYVDVSMVLMYSLFMNNSDVDITVYVMNCELVEEDKVRISKLADAWRQRVVFADMEDISDYDGLPTTDSWTKETYFRLMMAKILPDNIERILYLDVDMIVNGSIWDFYNTDFEGNDLVVCEDVGINQMHRKYYQDNFKELADGNFTYFNAGMILWNFKQTREKYGFNTYKNLIINYLPILQCLDQDVLNVVHRDKVKVEDWRRYNLLVTIADYLKFPVENVKSTCYIIHFIGQKPWNEDSEYKELFKIWFEYRDCMLNDNIF